MDFFISISILYRCCLHRSHENSQLKPWILHTQRHAIHHFIWINFIAPHSWHVIWLFICNAHHMKNLCADRTRMLRHLIESKFCAPTTLVNTHNRHMSIYTMYNVLCALLYSQTHTYKFTQAAHIDGHAKRSNATLSYTCNVSPCLFLSFSVHLFRIPSSVCINSCKKFYQAGDETVREKKVPFAQDTEKKKVGTLFLMPCLTCTI